MVEWNENDTAQTNNNHGYIHNNTKKVEKQKCDGLEAIKRGRGNERDCFFLLIKIVTMEQDKQKFTFFTTFSAIVGQNY